MRPRAVLLAALIVLAGCAPVSTKNAGSGFVMISERDEFALGNEFAAAYDAGRMKGMPKPDFIELSDGYLDSLGRELAGASQRPGVPYRFRAINDNTINAFAVPGHIYVYRGVIELCATECEFAEVLGHEIGHVVARHTAKNVSKEWALTHGADFVLAMLGVGQLGQELSYLVLVGAFKKFGRDEERQADLLGVEECLAAGISPLGAARVFRKFETALKERPNLLEGFLNDHPYSAERADNVEAYLRTAGVPAGLREDRPAYQAWRAAILALPKPPDRKGA